MMNLREVELSFVTQSNIATAHPTAAEMQGIVIKIKYYLEI